MRSVEAFRGLTIAAAVVGLAAAVSGQARSASTPPGTSDEQLLAEVRALRAEIAEAANTAMRAQLLAMRLQLQEQRIGVIARQLSDVQERLRSNDRAKESLAAQVTMFEGMMKEESTEKSDELEHVLGPLRLQLGGLEKSEEALKAEETSISNLLTAEQSRWASFNAQVEELERAAIRKAPR
jgi:chromosome segregation ATPase